MASELIKHVTDASFEADVLQPGTTVLVDFWAEWCGPCKMLGPVLEQVANEVDGKAVVGKVNVDEAPGLAKNFMVRTVPTLFILKDGKPVKSFVGVQDKAKLVKEIESV